MRKFQYRDERRPFQGPVRVVVVAEVGCSQGTVPWEPGRPCEGFGSCSN